MEDTKGRGMHGLSLYLLSVLHMESVISMFYSKCLFLCLPHKAKQIPADLTQAAFQRALFHVEHANGDVNTTVPREGLNGELTMQNAVSEPLCEEYFNYFGAFLHNFFCFYSVKSSQIIYDGNVFA